VSFQLFFCQKAMFQIESSHLKITQVTSRGGRAGDAVGWMGGAIAEFKPETQERVCTGGERVIAVDEDCFIFWLVEV
jgi:hypothetical protein